LKKGFIKRGTVGDLFQYVKVRGEDLNWEAREKQDTRAKKREAIEKQDTRAKKREAREKQEARA
jgi:hypothetical protein